MISRIMAWAAFCLILAGCENPMLMTGYYEGTLIPGEGWQNLLGDEASQKRISIDIDSKDRDSGEIRVKDIYQKNLFSIALSRLREKSLDLEIPEIGFGRETLRRKEQSNEPHALISDCFVSDQIQKISLCLGAQAVFLSVQDRQNRSVFSMKAGRCNRTGDFALEEPRVLTTEEALDRVLKSGFESIIEFERKFQAIEKARSAELMLVPHFRFINAVALITLAPPVLIVSLGDWVPFLFPIHWVRAIKTGLLAESEKISYEIIRANLILQTQSLIYAYQTHLENLTAIEPILLKAYQLRKDLNQVKKEGPTILLDSVQSFILTLETNKANLMGKLAASRISLSETLGFLNPEAVLGVQSDIPPLIGNQLPLIFEAVMADAVASSLEIRQMDFLLKATHQERAEIYLSWTYPDTDKETPLGFNLIPQIRSQRSREIKIQVEKEQRRQKVIQNAFKAVSLHNSSIASFRSALDRRALEKKRLDAIFQRIEELAPYTEQDMHLELYSFQLARVAEEFLASEFELERHITRFQWARSWIDRLTFTGPYAKILEELEN